MTKPRSKRAGNYSRKRKAARQERDTLGQFAQGNSLGSQAGKASKDNHLQHGKAGADRLAKDVRLHGRRSKALTQLLAEPQPWAEAVRTWREGLVNGYGGWSNMTPITHELLSMATIMKIITDSVGDYATRTYPVNRKVSKLFPIVESLDKLLVSQANRLEKFAHLMCQSKQHQEPSLQDLLNEPEPPD